MSSIASQLSFSKARDIVGGATGSIPYQTANSSTVFVPIGTNGFVLTSNGTTATWIAASGVAAGSANTVLVTATTTASSYYLTFVDSNNAVAAYESLYTDAGILYNPSTDLLTLTGDIAVNGGDITTNQTTFNLVDATATTVNFARASTALTIGSNAAGYVLIQNNSDATSTATGALRVNGGIGVNRDVWVGQRLNVASDSVITGNEFVNGGTFGTSQTTFNLLNTTATTINFGGAATTLTIGANAAGTVTIRNNTDSTTTATGGLVVYGGVGINRSVYIGGNNNVAGNEIVTGDVSINGGDLQTSQTTFNLLNTTATTINFGGASTSMIIGANAAGTVTIRNNTNATTTATGGLVVYGGVGIGGNLYVGGTINGTISNAGNATNILTTATTTASSYFLTFVDSNNAVAAYEAVYTDAGLTYNPSSDLLTLSGNITINGGSLQTNQTTFTLLGTTVTTASVLSSGTAITIGELTGFTAVRNQFTVTNITAASSTVTGALQVSGGAGIGGNLYVGGTVHGTVNSATNLAGGAAMSVVYQSAANTTAFLAAGTAGFILQTNGTGAAPSWVSASGVSAGSANTATNADNIRTVTRNTAATHFLTFVDSDNATNAYELLYTDPGIAYNPSSDLLTLNGNITVNGGSLQTNQTTFNLIDTTATTVNAFGAGTAITIGATTGATTIRNATTITSTTAASSTATGALQVRGGAGIGGNLYIGGNAVVAGNLTIQGATTIVDSTVTNVADPIFIIGSGPNGANPTLDDNKDRGIQFKWHNGTTAKDGFFGYDDSTGFFTFVPDATITNEVVSGTKGALDANLAGGAAMSVVYQSAANTTAFLPAGTAGFVLQTNGTGSAPTWVAASGLGAGSATNANFILTTATSTASSYFLTFVDSNNTAAAQYEAVYTDAGLSYNPSTDLLTLTGDIDVNGGDLNTNQTTFNLVNANATTVNFAGASTALTIGANAAGFVQIRNNTNATSTATGALRVNGGAGINGDVYAAGDVYTRGSKLVPQSIQEFTATGGQTTFTISGGYTVGTVQVFANGVQLGSGAFVASNGTTVVVNTARVAGDIIRVISGGSATLANNIQSYSLAMSIALGA